MQSLTRGWSFFTQSWKMVAADKDLIKPSFYALIVGFFVTLIFMVPIIAAVLILDTESLVGRIIIGVLGAILIFAQYAVTYIFSAMTIQLIYDYLSNGDGKMSKAWATVQRDWFDILTLAAASTLVTLIKNAIRGGSGRNRNVIGEAIGNLIGAVWTEATFIVLPIMVIEDVNLKDGLKRATFIVKNNLMLIGVGAVGINWINGIIGFLLVVLGLLLGFGIAMPLIGLAGDSTPLIVIAVILGVGAASIFFIASTIITTYTSTAYHTCLYIWARDVEKARAAQPAGMPVNITAPQPLATALGN